MVRLFRCRRSYQYSLQTAPHSRHIDGHDYFYALSEMLDSARECIFILVRLSLASMFLSSLPPYMLPSGESIDDGSI